MTVHAGTENNAFVFKRASDGKVEYVVPMGFVWQWTPFGAPAMTKPRVITLDGTEKEGEIAEALEDILSPAPEVKS